MTMTPEIQAIHDKLDELLREVRMNRNEERRHGTAIGALEERVTELEHERDGRGGE